MRRPPSGARFSPTRHRERSGSNSCAARWRALPVRRMRRGAGPTADDAASAAKMTDEQRRDMIRGMVGRLAERLQNDGADVEGWLRLVRSYVVLGDRDRAKGVAADARRALAGRPDEVKRIDDLLKGLGLEG